MSAAREALSLSLSGKNSQESAKTPHSGDNHHPYLDFSTLVPCAPGNVHPEPNTAVKTEARPGKSEEGNPLFNREQLSEFDAKVGIGEAGRLERYRQQLPLLSKILKQ